MSRAVPPAIIFVNNDLVPQIRNWLVKQLHIDEYMSGAVFDARVDGYGDGYYVASVYSQNKRIMVIRDFRETTNRSLADVVIFVKEGLASIQKNKFGPPEQTHQVQNLYWGQLGVY